MLQESTKSTFKGLKGLGTSKFRRKHIKELGRTDSKGSVIVSFYRHLCLSVNSGNTWSVNWISWSVNWISWSVNWISMSLGASPFLIFQT